MNSKSYISNLVSLYLNYVDNSIICFLAIGCAVPYIACSFILHCLISRFWTASIAISPHYIITRNPFICVYI